jgi:hypothetical protein
MKSHWVYRSLLAVILILSATGLALAQSASLSGIVTDKTKAIVPGAAVTLTGANTGIKRTNTTNNQGVYNIPFLMPGNYTITVQASGFQTVSRTDIKLEVNQTARLDFELTVGQVTTTIDVTEQTPLISVSSAVGTVINRQFAGNLPLNGRSFQSLILLTPGVTVTSADSNKDDGQFSVNGQRASANYFTVDGVSANIGMSSNGGGATSAYMAGAYPGMSAFGGTNNLVSVDALEEFKIQTSTFTAEFGRQPGGQVVLVTRSGSNQFHGTLFDYLRNDALDARDYFDSKLAPKPALRQNQFGGTFSGPIFKDKTFFFFSYEGQRLRLPDSGITYVPSLRMRSAAAAAVKPFLNAFPQPTGAEILDTTGLPSGLAPYDYSVSNPGTMDATSIRMDHILSSKLTLFGRFSESPSNTTVYANSEGGAYSTLVKAATRTLTLGATSVFTPRLSNELRFNYSRQLGQGEDLPATYGGAVPVDRALLTNGYDGVGSLIISLTGGVAGVWGGDTSKNYQRQINIVDNVSVVNGAHQFKFGVDYRRLSPTYAIQNQQIVYFFSEGSVNSAIADQVSIKNRDSARLRFVNFSVYGQDTWKVTPRLTLDLGLRWELNPAPTEADGIMPAVALGITGNPPDVSKATLAPPGTPFYKTFYTAFAPRFGAAYQLNQASGRETVLRGGFGVYYDLNSIGATVGLPLTASTVLRGVPFPVSANNAMRPEITVPTSLPTTIGVSSNSENLQLPYTLQWSVAVEQSLGTQQSLSLSYVGSAARRLLTTQYLNYPAGYTTGPRPNPNFSYITYTWNGPTSDFHSFQAQYKARLTSGLQGLVNYTWSHAIDDVSSDLGTLELSRGNADFDIRHNLSAAFTFNLPSPHGAPVLKHVLGNWTMDGIVHAQSGRPVNVYAGYTDINGMGVRWRPDVVPGQPFYINDPSVPGGRRFNSAAFKAPPANPDYPGIPIQGNFGRNVLRDFPITQTDFALGRNFNLTEKFKLQFKGELFNIFNHPMFTLYSLSGSNFSTPSTFGVPTRTLNNGLGGLNSLYQMGGPRSIQFSMRLTF